MSVASVTEISATSAQSFEDAVKKVSSAPPLLFVTSRVPG
jgi:hypothetical protein